MSDPTDATKTIRLDGPKGGGELFELLELAGQGGMGTVHRARDLSTGEIVAVKRMAKDEAADPVRFALEASVLARLRHPAIVSYRGKGQAADGTPYLVMEWLEGESLEARLRRGPMSLDEVVRIGEALASGLAAAHEAGIVHRDVKPSNVFLLEDGSVKLVDFGVARVEGTPLTATGQAIGTLGYFAPEQARGAKEIDGRADLFSLGCVLFRAVTGEKPFGGEDLMAYASALIMADAPPLSSLAPYAPKSLGALVAKLLARQAIDRPKSAEDVRVELARIARELADSHDDTIPAPRKASTLSSTGVSDVPRTISSPRPKRWPLPLYLVLGGAAAALLGFGVSRLSPTASVTSATARVEPTPPVEAGTPKAEAAKLMLGPAREACREWSARMLEVQSPDGSFRGQPNRSPTGWDTAQILTGLALALPACGGSKGVLFHGATALRSYRLGAGYSGGLPRFGGPNAKAPAQTPATAWAALALGHVAKLEGSPKELVANATEALDLLARIQKPNGGIPYDIEEDREPDTYSTMLAAWAFTEADSPKHRGARDKALAWVRASAANEQPRSVKTLGEGVLSKALWVLHRADEREGKREGRVPFLDEPLLVAGAKAIVLQCAPDARGACTHLLLGDKFIPIGRQDDAGPIGGSILMLWHPWTTLAAATLSRDPSLPLPADLRADLDRVASWGIEKLEASVPMYGTSDAYKVSEQLMAVSLLLEMAERP